VKIIFFLCQVGSNGDNWHQFKDKDSLISGRKAVWLNKNTRTMFEEAMLGQTLPDAYKIGNLSIRR